MLLKPVYFTLAACPQLDKCPAFLLTSSLKYTRVPLGVCTGSLGLLGTQFGDHDLGGAADLETTLENHKGVRCVVFVLCWGVNPQPHTCW